MELKEFVKETLVQISEGVKESQGSVRNVGGYVNPTVTYVQGKPELVYFGETALGHHTFLVDFDVAVIVAEKKGAEGGAKLSVASFISIGGGGSSDVESKSTSRVKFKVPLAFPFDEQSMKEKRQQDEESIRKTSELEGRHRHPMSM
jgi:hypothetical protein